MPIDAPRPNKQSEPRSLQHFMRCRGQSFFYFCTLTPSFLRFMTPSAFPAWLSVHESCVPPGVPLPNPLVATASHGWTGFTQSQPRGCGLLTSGRVLPRAQCALQRCCWLLLPFAPSVFRRLSSLLWSLLTPPRLVPQRSPRGKNLNFPCVPSGSTCCALMSFGLRVC